MQTFFHRLLGTLPPRPEVKPAPVPRDNPLTIEDGSENATRRQLVQVLLRDVLRRSGIPPAWIDCQMLLVSSRTKGHGMYVRLVLKHWDHRLMNYTSAFQQALMTDIERFEPKALQWLHGVSWQLEMGESCPYTELPEKAFWLEPVNKPATYATTALQAIEPAPVFDGAGLTGALLAPVNRVPAAATTGRPASDNPARELEQLFAIRDRELEQLAAEGMTPVGYEKTQPSPL